MTAIQEVIPAPARADRRGRRFVTAPIDDSEGSRSALPIGRALAALGQTPLRLLHVGPRGADESEALEQLGLAPEELRGAVFAFRTGPPADEIVRHAREAGSGYLVMATGTGTPGTGEVLGSVARAVVASEVCPVILVPPNRGTTPWTLRHLLLPHDGIPTVGLAIRQAADLADRAGAELTVLHVAAPGTPPLIIPGAYGGPQYLDQPQHEWPSWVDEFLGRVRAVGGLPEGLRVRVLFESGELTEVVSRVAAEYDSDLIGVPWMHGWEDEHSALEQLIHVTGRPFAIFPVRQPERAAVV